MNDHDYYDPWAFNYRPAQVIGRGAIAKVTITVEVPLADAVSPNSVVLTAMQQVAKSVVDNDNDTYKAMKAAGWRADIETSMF